MQIIFPLLRDERVRLKITEEEFGDADTLGVMLTPSAIRVGIRRWQKQGKPSVFEGDEVSLAVSAIQEQIQEILTEEKQKRAAAEQALLEEFETEYVNLNTAAESDLEAQKAEAEKNNKLYAKRLQLKDKRIKEFQDALNAEKEKAQTYQSHFGDVRSRPLNWFQRFIGKLCRILS